MTSQISPWASVAFDVGSSVPDSQDLHARYDATELSANDGDSISTWPDETGNGHDLTAGTSPTFKTGVIGGNPVVRFDGVDDLLDVAFSTISQPYHIWIVIQQASLDSTPQTWLGSETNSYSQLRWDNGDGFDMYAGNDPVVSNTGTTDPVIVGGLFDGSNSEYRINGSGETVNAGTNSLDGLTVAANKDGNGQGIQIDVGEIIIYPIDKSSVANDVDQYLSDKWGISI